MTQDLVVRVQPVGGKRPRPNARLGDWPALLFPKLARGLRNGAAGRVVTAALAAVVYTRPLETTAVDWAEGKYALTVRGGRVESHAGWGAEKKLVRMVTEGSVVSSGTSPKGQAVDVAPDRFAHPVYRAGFALALQLPVVHIVEERRQQAMEEVAETSGRSCGSGSGGTELRTSKCKKLLRPLLVERPPNELAGRTGRAL